MTNSSNQKTRTQFGRRVGRGIKQISQTLSDRWNAAGASLRNESRVRRKLSVDYIVLPLSGSLPERSGPPRGFIQRRLPLPGEPLSLQMLNERLQAIADADNVRGVVIVLLGLSARLATLQNLRQSIQRLRAAGKEAIVYTPYLDLPHYYVATAADHIIVPPSAEFSVLGFFSEATFLKDSLSRVGIEADVVQISPYKTAFDRFGKSEMTEEYRAQLNWLLDDLYDMITCDMAAGRNMEPETLKRLIDEAPFPVAKAQAAGLVDRLTYDDELPVILANGFNKLDAAAAAPNQVPPSENKIPPQAKLKTWKEARRILLEKPRRHTQKFVGVVSLEGMITMGPSRQPPIDIPIPFIGGASAGEQTLVGLLRRIDKLNNMAALIFHVDSGGGSALASDLIGRQLEQIAAKMPVVVYMGNIAASGGYYVAAPAKHIMSQPATTTGSIGVITAHISSQGLYEKLSVKRVTLSRGQNAGLYQDSDPLTDNERDILWRSISDTYDQFKTVVAKGRDMTVDAVDAIGGGRVWTGRQALNHKLVDSHGDFIDAIQKAAALANLPADDVAAISVVNVFPKGSAYTLPNQQPNKTLAELGKLLGGEAFKANIGRPLMLIPFDLRLW